jgi:hypothetical protein
MKNLLHIELMVAGIRTTASFENGNDSRVSIFDLMFGSRKIPNCLSISYQISVSDDSIKNQMAINNLLQNEIDPAVDILSLLLNKPFKFLDYAATVNGSIIKFQTPANSSFKRLYNFKNPASKFRGDFSYSVLVKAANWSKLFSAIDAFRILPEQNRKPIQLPLHWFAMASQEPHSPDRFIRYWIAFNALYSDPDKKEQDAIKKYFDNQVEDNIVSNFIKFNRNRLEIISTGHIELGRKRMISEELRNVLASKNSSNRDIMKLALLALYGIRNNLFHGSYCLSSSDVFSLLEAAEIALSDFLRRKLLSFFNVKTQEIVIEEASGV